MARAKRKKRDSATISIRSHLFFRIREGTLIAAITMSLFMLVALFSYHRGDPSWSNTALNSPVQNAGGEVGAYLADLFLYFFGYLAYLLPVVICYVAWLFYRHKHRDQVVAPLQFFSVLMKSIGFIAMMFTGCGLLALHLQSQLSLLPYHSGGILGAMVMLQLVSKFNFVGATLILMACFLISVTLLTGMSWFKIVEWLGARTIDGIQHTQYFWEEFEWEYYKEKMSIDTGWFKQVLAKLQQFKTKSKEDASLKIGLAEASVSDDSTKVFYSSYSTVEAEKITSTRKIKVPRYKKSNAMPKLSLLDTHMNKANASSSSNYRERSAEVEKCLLDFGVQVKVSAVHPGPVVTRYELALAAGTKASKITGLAKDLARSLSVVSVRVVEVIPGKSVVGIELPNEKREMVSLQEVLASKQYDNARSPLSLALGKDIAGYPVIVDLAKMPHLLVAGTTGAGKSVCLNAMLLSLLYKSTPEQLRIILIDPKMLELSVYDDIPHLLTPVVTDMKDASSALRWSVAEMERRYRLMASLGVRNIMGYNEKVRQAIKRGSPLLDPLMEEDAKELQLLPQIVIIADEFADMMVVVGKKVETLIARLAQKARASGIHLVLATQRPSVDVITGLIKANIPTRIAFQVSSKVDSRTILDQQGAEQLLGYGDMLYLPPGSGVPVRVHGAFVSDDEVHRVVDYLKQQSSPDYLEDILDESANTDPTGYTNAAGGQFDGEQDELYDEAVAFIAKARRVSVSSIQRRFKIGYNRAARIVETMEAAGVVSKQEGHGAREVLVPPPKY